MPFEVKHSPAGVAVWKSIYLYNLYDGLLLMDQHIADKPVLERGYPFGAFRPDALAGELITLREQAVQFAHHCSGRLRRNGAPGPEPIGLAHR